MKTKVIARKTHIGDVQSLAEHTINVSMISAKNSHFPHISKLIAYLHDLGKLSDEFQNYINIGGERGSVIHAWQGAFFVNELASNNDLMDVLLKEVVSFCITAHHNYLPDGISLNGTADFYMKLSDTNSEKYYYDEIKSKVNEEEKLLLEKCFIDAKDEMSALITKITSEYSNKNSCNFAIGLFVKYIYSCLIDADRLDAYLFNINSRFEVYEFNWNSLIDKLEKGLSKFSDISKINKIRKSISEKCMIASKKETGIYQLSVPTGGGKTLSSLRFALHHCLQYKKKRIIYIIPYLSIIEQTANNIRSILELSEDNDIIFEHHSNIVQPEDEKSSELSKLYSSRWSSPIIITTMVQFLETIMSSKAGRLRKFQHMADSVLIFDEIQSLPVKTIHCFNETISFLSRILNSTVILCSATQPILEMTQRKNLSLAKNPKLIDCTDDFKDIQRVRVIAKEKKDFKSATNFIIAKAIENGNCLVILNTKISALKIFNLLTEHESDFEILHLSTSMCSEHRMNVINQMKKMLNNKEKVICVSTQLVEAGIDISFSCVVRAMAGLDSIAQAAGRCNRNGESYEPKYVYTFQLEDENLDRLPDIKSGRIITIEIVNSELKTENLIDESIMNMFYHKYFSGKEQQMDYPTNTGISIYTMLSNDKNAKIRYNNITGEHFAHVLFHSFHSADTNFNVIDNNTKPVIVLYNDAQSLIDDYHRIPESLITEEKFRIIKKLQKYSVGLYEYQIKTLFEQRALSMLDEESGIIVLDKLHYSDKTGVVLETLQDELII